MTELPSCIYSGTYKNGHVQGIAIDAERGFVYYSFTTILVKTDLNGNFLGSVTRLAGHLGCISYDAENDRIYGSLELKHDSIGKGIIGRTGWDPSAEDSFYLAVFDCSAIVRADMDAEKDGVMTAVYLSDVVRDYSEVDEASGKKHRYGCSGVDGTALGPDFGKPSDSPKKIMIAYGVYSENDREDNDYQVILCFDRSVVDEYAKPLDQALPHHSGPERSKKRYFFYTGNTTFGVQNLEYDPASGNWFVTVYRGSKPSFENFNMFFIDGKQSPVEAPLIGRGGERGLILTSARLGVEGRQEGIRGSHFEYGSTGMASMGGGIFYFSHNGANDDGFFTSIVKYKYAPHSEYVFERIESEDSEK